MRQLFFLVAAILLAAAAPLASAAPEEPPAAGATFSVGSTLDELVSRVRGALPPEWRIVEADVGRVPIGWSGDGSGLYVMVEDTTTRFYHPNGFHYYSFYRVWLLPPDWEGEMRHTPYVSDSVPAFLLGMNDRFVAFYHTAGGNTWDDGPRSLCDALGLDEVCYTSLSRRIVDLEFEERLLSAVDEDGDERADALLCPHRIIGLSGHGANLYMEYVVSGIEENVPEVDMALLTERLAGEVFGTFPEVESLYLRRCNSDTFTDTIVARDE